MSERVKPKDERGTRWPGGGITAWHLRSTRPSPVPAKETLLEKY
jgi:hypothetical protein